MASSIWVAQDGDDRWSGNLAQSNAARTDGPKATLAGAIAASRGTAGPDTINVQAGNYYQQDPVLLGAADRGLEIIGQPGAAIHGGINLSDRSWIAEGNGIYSTQLDRSLLPNGLLDLHVNGVRQTSARYPNEALDNTPGDTDKGWLFASAGTSGHEKLSFKAGDLPHLTAADIRDLTALVYDDKQWGSATVKISNIDYAGRSLTLNGNVPWHQLDAGSRYYISGAKPLLDAPREWYYDRSTGKLFFKPEDPSVLNSGKLVGATAETLIEINGTSDIEIRGLELRDGSPNGSNRDFQYFQIGGGAIKIVDSQGLEITGNYIQNFGVGVNALHATNTLIANNTIDNIAGNGIFIGMPWGGQRSANVSVIGNKISDTGHLHVESGGIFVIGTENPLIDGNIVERTSQFGIYAGQVRGTGEDVVRNAVIQNNIVRDANLATADGGGIKLFAMQAGGVSHSLIQNNWIDGMTYTMNRTDGSFYQDVDWLATRWPLPVSAALYLDYNTIDTTIRGNLVTRGTGGLLANEGTGTVVENNVIYDTRGSAVEINDPSSTNNFEHNIYKSNIFVRNDPNSGAIKIWDVDGHSLPVFQNNAFAGSAIDQDAFTIQPGGGFLQTGIDGWRSGGYTNGDVKVALPLFVDPAHGNFTLLPNSPLTGLGFTGLDAGLLQKVAAAHGMTPTEGSPPAAPPVVAMPPTEIPPVPAPPPPVASSPWYIPPEFPLTIVSVVVSGDAYRDPWGGNLPEFMLSADGKAVAPAMPVIMRHDFNEWQTFTFLIDRPISQIDEIDLKYVNDGGIWAPDSGWVKGQDRNLYVDRIEINDVLIQPEKGTWMPHWGEVLPGRGDLWANGTLNFDLDKLGLGLPGH